MQKILIFLLIFVSGSASRGQMTPAEYGQAVGSGFQNSYQNMLMGMQSGREQRELDLQYRQQQLTEQKWEMERKLLEQERQLTEQRLENLKMRAQKEKRMHDEIMKIVEENKTLEKEIARLSEDPRMTGQIIPEEMPSPRDAGQEAKEDSLKGNNNTPPGETVKDIELKIPEHLKEHEKQINKDIIEYRKKLNRLWLEGEIELLKITEYDMSEVNWAPAPAQPEIFILIDSYAEKYKARLLQFGK